MRQILRRVEVALQRILNQPVLQAIERVAFIVNALRERGQLLRCNLAGTITDRNIIPDRLHLQAAQEQHRSANHVSVEILRVALRFHQALAAASRTAHPIRITRVGPIVGADDFLGKQSGFVHGEIAVIDHLARGIGIVRAGIGEGGSGFLHRVVARVGGGRCVALAHRSIDVADCSGPAAVADHLKAAVPIGWQLQSESGFGPDNAANVAMLTQIGGRRDQFRGFDLDVGAEGHRGQFVAFLDRAGEGVKGSQGGHG